MPRKSPRGKPYHKPQPRDPGAPPPRRRGDRSTPAGGHVPVLLAEVLTALDPQSGHVVADCTVGLAGHAAALLERVGPTGLLVGCELDPTARPRAAERLTAVGFPFHLHAGNFAGLPVALAAAGVLAADRLLADLGVSSLQLDDPGRGFSFRRDGPLDMRLDPTVGRTAADLVNTLSEAALADVLFEFGEERLSRRVARRIVERRAKQPFATTGEVAEVVRRAVPRAGGIDPATRTFQALRVAVNDELGALDRLLAALPTVVRGGGRVGVISFHSLEDRRVKHAFRTPAVWTAVTKRPAEASAAEAAANPRSRSAKLRVAVRI
jgi:16S rRNA (cytosine1402-N4)-methyltransferase